MIKNYSGDLFDRLSGLDILLNLCYDMSVLDIGCDKGLISYEFARNGATLIHGIDINESAIDFANRLFIDVPIESEFIHYDLAINGNQFKNEIELSNKYDIILYLGMYHHLINQVKRNVVHDLIIYLLSICKGYFAIRTNKINDIHDLILDNGFKHYYHDDWNENVGALNVYFNDRR